jgi:phage-related holin
MRSIKGTMLGTIWTKIVLSLLAAIGMYWMRIPHQVVLLMYAQAADLIMGQLVAIANGEWAARSLGRGIVLKAAAYPLLAVCDLAEEPLHLSFHLDSYAALALIVYEFLSVVENYAKIRPLPKIVQLAAEKAQEYLSTPNFDTKKVETLTKTVTIQPTKAVPIAPAAIVTTVTRETHTEPVNQEDKK